MELKILGSGGALRIPRACCNCKICREARKKGPPYERLGQSLFLEEENVLFDTPEDINIELNNHKIKRIKHLFFSHWHPDHTAGVRILEIIKANKKTEPINIYLTESLKKDFKNKLPTLFYLEEKKYCKIINIEDEVNIDGTIIKFIKLNNNFTYAFLIKEQNKKIVFCPCHCIDLPILDELKNADILIINLGYFGKDIRTITGFEKDNLRLIVELKPKKTILAHIEETQQKSYDDYFALEKEFKQYNLRFAFDGMGLTV